MTSDTLPIGVAGALGRMGKAVAAQVRGREGVSVGALFDRPEMAGQAIDGAALVSAQQALETCRAIIDFTSAEASSILAEAAAARGGPALVIGSTGLSAQQEARIQAAAGRVAIVKSGNFSLGVNVLLGLVRKAAAGLGPEDYDIEVFEAHHRRKVDAPSGTALMLGGAAADGRGVTLDEVRADDRTGARRIGDIGFSVMRGGGVVGEHSVVFAAEDEILTLSHSARDRGLFARGAVAAAVWAADRPPGLYDMLDVLGFRS